MLSKDDVVLPQLSLQELPCSGELLFNSKVQHFQVIRRKKKKKREKTGTVKWGKDTFLSFWTCKVKTVLFSDMEIYRAQLVLLA